METKVTMTLDEIFALVLSVLTANGLSRDQAEAIADIVTRAEADACRSHGLYRVEGYVATAWGASGVTGSNGSSRL